MNEKINHGSLPGLTGNQLKLIAMAAMLIDHIGYGIVYKFAQEAQYWGYFYKLCRMIGRIAFPIYIYLLVIGFFHTSNIKKYLGRLFGFALLSEIPFDLFISGSLFFPKAQNVFFTLFLALLVLCGMRYVEICDKISAKTITVLLQFGVASAGAAASMILHTDYAGTGIFLASAFYLFRNDPISEKVSTGVLMFYESITNYGAAVLAWIPLHFYNGKRTRNAGGKNHFLSIGFYCFYPLHLFLLYLIGNGVIK